MSAPELSRRAKKILQAVVSEYLHSGDAVGSRTVTRRHDIGLSPATVRNVMSDLEEMGLLEQRHTSAGRVPTESGLRFFIQSLLKVRGLSPREKDEIRARLTAPSPDEVVQQASRLLSEITQHAAVIVAPDLGGTPGAPCAFLTDGAHGINLRRGTWHGVLTPLHAPGLFAVVDRIGSTPNLEEYRYDQPFTVVA